MQAVAFAEKPAKQEYRFAYQGTGGDLFVLILKNVFLTIVTLGIYAAWARNAQRKFLLSSTDFAGQRFEYTGTGMEIFIGFLKVVGVFLAAGVAEALVKLVLGKTAGFAFIGILYLALLAAIPHLIWGAQRYRLSRIKWRGIQMHLSGDRDEYVKTFYIGMLLTMVTIGFYGPIMGNRLHKILTKATHLGSQPLDYTGDDIVVWKKTMIGLLLTILTAGIYGFWFQADLIRYKMSQTTFSGAVAQSDLSGGDLFVVFLMQMFLTAITAGIAFPWVITMTLRKILSRLFFVGHIDFDAIVATKDKPSATAEGFVDALGINAGI